MNRVLFLGDSLTAGFGVGKEVAFPAQIEANLRDRGIEIHVFNAGISGSTSAGGEFRFNKHTADHDFDVLLLALGANDGLRGLPVSGMKNNLGKVIKLAQSKGMRVVLAGMHIPPNYGQPYTTAFRQVYLDLAKLEGVSFLPFLLEGVAGRPEYNLPDGIHPNAQGHKIIATAVQEHLLECCLSKP